MPTKSPRKLTVQRNGGPRPPLVKEDWDFSEVTDSELVSCLLFEYLRESPTARQLETDLKAGANAEVLNRLHALRFKINHRLDMPRFIENALDSAWETGEELLNTPWQKLPPRAKEILIYHCERVEKPAYISTLVDEVRELSKHMLLGSYRDQKAFEVNHDAPATTYACVPLDDLDGGEGRVGFMVIVNSGRYDHNAIRAEIANDVANQIIKSLPKGVTPQVRMESGLGRLNEFRGILNSLGWARLSARYTAREIKTNMPKIYAQIAKPLGDDGHTAVQKKLDSARHRCVARFHKILPFEKHPPLFIQHSRYAK